MIMVFFSFFILVIFWQNFVGGKVHCLLSMYGNCMKHNSYQSHFQTKQLPAGQHGKFTWPTWTHCEICGGIFHPHRNSRLCGFLLKWVDFVWENLLDISKCDHTFTLTYKALQTAHSLKERLQFWMVEVNRIKPHFWAFDHMMAFCIKPIILEDCSLLEQTLMLWLKRLI